MKVILIKDCALGKAETVLEVKDGYAKNFLLPQGLVLPFSPKNKLWLEQQQVKKAQEETKKLKAAQELAHKLEKITLNFQLKIHQDSVHGSVTSKQILTALSEQYNIQLSKHAVKVPLLNKLGEFRVEVLLHSQVVSHLKLIIQAKA